QPRLLTPDDCSDARSCGARQVGQKASTRGWRLQHDVLDLGTVADPVNHFKTLIVAKAEQGAVVAIVIVCANHEQNTRGPTEVSSYVREHVRQDGGREITPIEDIGRADRVKPAGK